MADLVAADTRRRMERGGLFRPLEGLTEVMELVSIRERDKDVLLENLEK